MKSLEKYPSTKQYGQIVKLISDRARHHGNIPEKLTLHGTIKLHGSNVGIISDQDDFWVQSRDNVLGDGKNNYTSVEIFERNKDLFRKVIDRVREIAGVTSETRVSIYGEIAGGAIGDKVGINHRDQFIAIFGVAIGTGENKVKWSIPKIRTSLSDLFPKVENGSMYEVFLITQFKTYEIEIDFANPKDFQNELAGITMEVERRCPVAEALIPKDIVESGVELIGEGVVWSGEMSNGDSFIFKVKGAAHSNSNVKVLAGVDPEVLANAKAFVEYAATENRLKQGISVMKERGVDVTSMAGVGQFIKWLLRDCMVEEKDALQASNLTDKDVVNLLMNKAKQFYIDHLKQSK